jgi:hypothetical protein
MAFLMFNPYNQPRERCPSCGKVHRIDPKGVCKASKGISRGKDNERKKKYRLGRDLKYLTGER